MPLALKNILRTTYKKFMNIETQKKLLDTSMKKIALATTKIDLNSY